MTPLRPVSAGLPGVTIAPMRLASSFTEASALYRSVFDYHGRDDALNPRLLAALVGNGGTVLGARTPTSELVAFCYGFPGRSEGIDYHYSQATVIAASFQGRGLGRALKHAQAEAAVETGAVRMRWGFDPSLARNARFNLNVLGARGNWIARDLYGLESPSPRMIVEWEIGASTTIPRAQEILPPAGAYREGAVVRDKGRAWVGFNSMQAVESLIESLVCLFKEGFVAVTCAISNGFAIYGLEMWPQLRSDGFAPNAWKTDPRGTAEVS